MLVKFEPGIEILNESVFPDGYNVKVAWTWMYALFIVI